MQVENPLLQLTFPRLGVINKAALEPDIESKLWEVGVKYTSKN